MLGFLSVRKILEAGKMSTTVRGMHIPLVRFRRSSLGLPDNVAPLLGIYYDLENPERIQQSLAFLCNQIVHSYIFGVAVGNVGGLDGVYFASDREWRDNVFFASSTELARVLTRVGEDPNAEFSPWVEVRLDRHRVQVAFPPLPSTASNTRPKPSVSAERARSG